nr:hypothetical protein CFP56_40360 [Quercus suber]
MSLRSLPNLPLNIDYVRGFCCTSLETVPYLLKPNSSCEPRLYLTNCSKVANNQGYIDIFLARIKKHHQGVSFDDRYDTLHYEKRYDIIIPGMDGDCCLRCYGDFVFLSDHIWLLYMLPQYVARSPAWESDVNGLWECDANGFSQIGIRIETHGLKVKKCGFRMVYKKDIEDLNQTMAQTSDNNIIPHEGLDVLHHNFDNLAVVVEGNKAKKTHDEYDRAGPSGEGSSKNIPSLKLIERLPEFMDLGNSDCEEPSEYMECETVKSLGEKKTSAIEGVANSSEIKGSLNSGNIATPDLYRVFQLATNPAGGVQQG